MNGFEYQYHTPYDILNSILLLTDTTLFHLGVFWVLVILLLLFLLYILPAIQILITHMFKSRESKKRRNFIKQIAIQKDIEDQIAEEIDVS